MKVKGITSTGDTVWLDQAGVWNPDAHMAAEFHGSEAARRLRIINANNRFLDREDRVEAEILE